MSTRPDFTIRDAQMLTIGTKHTLAVDIREIDGQAFTVSTGTVSIYAEDGTVVEKARDVTSTFEPSDSLWTEN